MALHYILDGYNIIHRSPFLADKNLEESRRALIQFVNNRRPHGSSANKVTIVFDGNKDFWGGQDGGCALVVFAVDTDADGEIKRLIENTADPKQCVVVSDDKAVALYTRALGAANMSVKDFLSAGRNADGTKKTGGKGGHGSAGPQKHISHTDAARINDELSRLWLDKDK